MFWDNISTEPSSLVKLLESNNFTLDDLLMDEFFLQEFGHSNEELTEYLLKPETVEQLIKHLITEPPIELEEKIRFKKAHVTCGLFSHHFNKVENVIVSNEHLMNQLLQFLEQPSPLHPLLASFFSKAITCCLQKFQSQTLKLFQKRNNFFDLLVNHVDTSAIMDFIDSFFTITRQTEIDKMDENWINSSDISNKLLNVFTIERSIESHENAAYILFRLIEIYRNPQFLDDSDRFTILNVLESKVFIDLFLNKILANPTPSLVTNGMNVILSLVDYQKHLRIMTNQLEAKPASGQDLCAKKESDHSIRFFDCVYNVHEAILSRLHLLKNLLINPIETNPIELTTGIIEKPFGITRLKILSLLRSILTVNNPKFNTAIKDNQIFPLLIELFFKYPWNNFLHKYVEQFVQIVLLNLNPKSLQFVHLLDNSQANSTRLDESKLEDPTAEAPGPGSDLHEPAEMEITTLETTNANASAMDITISDVHQNESQSQPSLIEILRQLIVDAKLLDQIMAKLNEVLICQGMKTSVPLAAYNGHLTEIANSIENTIKSHEHIRVEIEKMLSPEQIKVWNKFISEELSKFNEKNSTAIGQIRSEANYKPIELDTDKGMLEHMSNFLSKTLQPSYSIFENDAPIKLTVETSENFQTQFEEHLAISNQTLAKFEKFCNERIKPVIFAQMAIEEDFGTPEEITVVADPDAEAKDPTPSNSHSTAAEAILLDEDSSSKKEDHSGFQVFFQPKASSSNLSTELKMEIDPFLEIPNATSMENTTPESIEANIWNSSNQGGDIENWADFSSYEKPSEPMVTCKEEVETEPSSMPADSNQSEQPRPEFSGEPSVADSNIIE